MEETSVKQEEQPKPDYKLVIPILAGFVVITFLAVFMVPSINAFINPADKVTTNINNTVMQKGQVLVYAYPSDNLKWEAMALDEKMFYYYWFNEDGTTIENTYTKMKSTKPYLYWMDSEETQNADYPKASVAKQANSKVEFIYLSEDVNSYVNYLITPLLREALPSTTFLEYCYGNCSNNSTNQTALELTQKYGIMKLPAIVINDKYINEGLIGSEEENTKTRFVNTLHFLCQFIIEEKCSELG